MAFAAHGKEAIQIDIGLLLVIKLFCVYTQNNLITTFAFE